MTSAELKERTKLFSVSVIRLTKKLPKSKEADVIAHQIIRSSTSVGANYRSACRPRSAADFISKITVVEEEADETAFWLELVKELSLLNEDEVNPVLKEANELTAIFTASGNTAKQNQRNAANKIANS